MITITREPREYSFIGNNILFELEADSANMITIEIIFRGESFYSTYTPFQSGDKYKLKIDVSGRFYIPDKELHFAMGGVIAPLSDFAYPYTVNIGEDYSFSGTAFRGGISNKNFALLASNGYDIFSYRLGSAYTQFLFTTRTNTTEVRLRETELFPFVFLNKEVPISFVSESGNKIEVISTGLGPVCSLDIFSLRELFTQQYGETPEQIKVLSAGSPAFSFFIEPGQTSEERYILKFLNSLGTYEMLEVTGRAEHAPEFSEENLYDTFSDFNFFEERRERVLSRGIIEVETGYKKRTELPFVLDLIKSPEIYFIYPNGEAFRCHVACESYKYFHQMVAPASIPLTVREVSDERFYTPKVDFNLFDDGIFDDDFDDEFE